MSQQHPNDPVVQFNFGTALFCAGYVVRRQSRRSRQAKKAGHDTFYEVQADNDPAPAVLPARGLPDLRAAARRPAADPGRAAPARGNQHSAERLYARAARLQPGNDEAQVAAAVGRFDEDNLSASFSRLGPLVKRFPRSQSVRYYLGLLLAWTGQRDQAIKEFRLARALESV